MTFDRNVGLIKLRPMEGEADPVVEIERESVFQEAQYEFGDVVLSKDIKIKQNAVFRYGYEVLGSYVVRLCDGETEKTLATVDILNTLDFDKQKLDNLALDAYDFSTIHNVDFGEITEVISKKGVMEAIITTIG